MKRNNLHFPWDKRRVGYVYYCFSAWNARMGIFRAVYKYFATGMSDFGLSQIKRHIGPMGDWIFYSFVDHKRGRHFNFGKGIK
jgi:hypothetical protein